MIYWRESWMKRGAKVWAAGSLGTITSIIKTDRSTSPQVHYINVRFDRGKKPLKFHPSYVKPEKTRDFDLSLYDLLPFDVYEAFMGAEVCTTKGVGVQIIDFDALNSGLHYTHTVLKGSDGRLYNGHGHVIHGTAKSEVPVLFHPKFKG